MANRGGPFPGLNLEPRLDATATMSRDKPLEVRPTARLPQGMDWDMLATMSPAEIRLGDTFPYKALLHPARRARAVRSFPRCRSSCSRAWSR